MVKLDNILLQKRIRQQDGFPLPKDVIKQFLESLDNGWIVNANNRLFKEYKFENFLKAMDFANEITLIAEEEKHHPNLHISWRTCSVEIWTHTINGLTENDFILAHKISKLTK